jgi:hypothetical protein
MRAVLLVAVAVALVGCGRGDPQKCDAACRNYASLMYWKDADVEIAKAPEEQRPALKKQKLAELAQKVENGVDFCVSKCQAANNDGQMKCMIEAKTAKTVKACADD